MTIPVLLGMFDDEPPAIRMAPAPSAIEARRDGHRVGRAVGTTLRDRYVALLRANGPLTDHEAGAALGALSTTVGARRMELMDARPGCIVAVGRVKVGRASRVRWALAETA